MKCPTMSTTPRPRTPGSPSPETRAGRTRKAALALSLGATLGACSDAPPAEERLFVFFEDLAPIGVPANGAEAGFEYALWRDDGIDTRLVERFTTRTGVVNLSLPAADIDTARTLFVTIERAGDASDVPSRSVLMAGDMIEGRAVLEVGHLDALGTGFDGATGTFRLATPTSLTEDDFAQGLWWYDGDESPQQSLFLPDLPQGWLYEGWIVSGDGARSTGKFADPGRFDLDAAGADGGDIVPPPFPGQDYVFDPIALVGLSAMITVEPDPDTSLAPSSVRILFDQVIEELRVNQPMENVATVRLPTGRVTTNRRREP